MSRSVKRTGLFPILKTVWFDVDSNVLFGQLLVGILVLVEELRWRKQYIRTDEFIGVNRLENLWNDQTTVRG